MGIDPIQIIISLLILVFSAILHEVAHGFVADRLGDPTARLMGRLTLNPTKHIDPFMTVLLPLLTFFSSGGAMIFGGAKPVPIDPYNFRDGRKDLAMTSLAGPLTNVLLAILAALLFHGIEQIAPFMPNNLTLNDILLFLHNILLPTIVNINILLSIFNLLPIPPLDGSKIFSLLLPPKEAAIYMSMSNVGMFILFFLLLFPIGGFSLGNMLGMLFGFARTLLGVQ